MTLRRFPEVFGNQTSGLALAPGTPSDGETASFPAGIGQVADIRRKTAGRKDFFNGGISVRRRFADSFQSLGLPYESMHEIQVVP